MDIVFSGIQPSGEPHLGNYLGAIRNWVDLQSRYQCFFSIVDYHAITASYEPGQMRARTLEMASDLLACGVDPAKATLFVQSQVPEHTELCWVFNSVTPMGELARMTQFKEKSDQHAENVNVGLFDYPVLQAADIALYKATRVPVGKDQVQHLELARELVRKFNARYGQTFPEPQPILSNAPKIIGLDGQAKMSKSLGNAIAILDEPDAIRAKLRGAFTDPQRKRRSDPGRPEVCNIFTLHGFFSPAVRRAEVEIGCRTAALGCVDCKSMLADAIIEHFAPIRERSRELRANPAHVESILREGAEKARVVAKATLAEVRARLGLWT